MGYKLCDHCKNANTVSGCLDCKNRVPKSGRDIVIDEMKEKGLIKDSGKLTNIVKASPLVLFKDLCKVKNIPFSLANKVTTTERLNKAITEEKLEGEDLMRVFKDYLTEEEAKTLEPAVDEIDFVYNMTGTVYNSSIHASGVLMDTSDFDLPYDPSSESVQINGSFADSLNYIKYDMLSLSTLDAFQEIVGIDVDWNGIESPELMKFLQEKPLNFVFQFGSSIVTDMIQGIPVEKLNTITLSEITSINRPGCLQIGMPAKWKDIQNGKTPMVEEADLALSQLIKI